MANTNFLFPSTLRKPATQTLGGSVIGSFALGQVFGELRPFLGGLSLHLNHLIASRVGNYDWQFGTLPFGLFWSDLDTMDLETYPRTYSGQFSHMSLFDDSRAV